MARAVGKASATHGVKIRASRCECCGGLIPLWTPEKMIASALAWVEKYDRAPTGRQWDKASYENPSSHTVRGFYLTFHNFLRAAGIDHLNHRWTREQAIQALFEDAYERGRLPVSKEWLKASPARPSYHTVRSLFGGWNAFLVAGGYTPAKAWTPAASKDQTAAVA
jgi:hypothetical protein